MIVLWTGREEKIIKQRCSHDFLAWKQTHILDQYLEICQYNDKIEFQVYDCKHNDKGYHDKTNIEFPIKYCPTCGKKLSN